MKIAISIPCMETLETRFVKCLLHLEPVDMTSINFSESSLVYESRDALVKNALEMEADYIMWFDSDMTFEPNTLKKLLAHDKDIITGLCFSRRPAYDPAIYKTLEFSAVPSERKSERYRDYPQNALFEVAGCGGACLLVKTEVYKKMIEKFKRVHTPFIDYGEDISFCVRAKELGYKIWCDSSVKLGHIARGIIDESAHRNFMNEVAKNGNT